jgi:putative colanic acid biosynthesis glycosyltransferase
MLNNKYRLSIISVTYNDEAGLKTTVESIDTIFENVDFSVIHCIIDGNSSDGTSFFLNNYIRNRKIPTFFLSEPDFGIYDAMNKGVLFSESDFVIFINSGDILLPGILKSKIFQFMDHSIEDPSVAGIASGCIYNFNGSRIKIKPREFSFNSPRMPSLHQGIIYKRSVILEIPYTLKYKICSDFENICKTSFKYSFLTQDISVSELIAGGVSTKKPFLLFSESVKIYNEFFFPNFFDYMYYQIRLVVSLSIVQVLFYITRINPKFFQLN